MLRSRGGRWCWWPLARPEGALCCCRLQPRASEAHVWPVATLIGAVPACQRQHAHVCACVRCVVWCSCTARAASCGVRAPRARRHGALARPAPAGARRPRQPRAARKCDRRAHTRHRRPQRRRPAYLTSPPPLQRQLPLLPLECLRYRWTAQRAGVGGGRMCVCVCVVVLSVGAGSTGLLCRSEQKSASVPGVRMVLVHQLVTWNVSQPHSASCKQTC